MNKTKEGKSSMHTNIRRMMRAVRCGMKCFELRDLYFSMFKKMYSESAFSARLREMKDVVCNLSDYTYSLVKGSKK
jgi:hypothetical protein